MKAIVCERYGSPEFLKLRDVAKPIPKENEILIRVHATTVTSGDCRVRSLNMPLGFALVSRFVFGFRRPKQPILGTEFSGVVTSVGNAVSKFKVGDEVFGMSGMKMGCYAEYKCMPESGAVAIKPESLTLVEAAALSFGGTTALDFFRRARLRKGESVLINGASGSVGSAAVQLARKFGAEVTAICSTDNAPWVRSIGATHVVDYTKDDFAKDGKTYDVILDAVGNADFSRCKVSLKRNGRLLLVVAGLPQMLAIPWDAITGSKRIVAGPAAERAEDLRFLATLAQSGEFNPVIDKRYTFEEIVDAHRYVDTGRKKGNVVVIMPKAS